MAERPSFHRQCHFTTLQVLIVSIIVLLLWWVFVYLGGLTEGEYADNMWVFNWHPVCMVLAWVVFFTNAVITYRVMEAPLLHQRFIFAVLQILTLVGVIGGISAVLWWKVERSINHFYSAHSWLGAFTLLAFVVQLTLVISPWAKEYSRFIIWMIVFTFVMALVTIETGIMQFADYRYISGALSYSSYPTEAIVLNTMGCLILLLLLLIMIAWFRAPYSATDKIEYEDLDEEQNDNTHMVRPMDGEFI